MDFEGFFNFKQFNLKRQVYLSNLLQNGALKESHSRPMEIKPGHDSQKKWVGLTHEGDYDNVIARLAIQEISKSIEDITVEV